jgi:hypothetical protein
MDDSVVRLRLSQLRLCRPRIRGSCWLALQVCLGTAAARSVLGDSAHEEPQRHALEPGAVRAGGLSTAVARQRMALASPVVRAQRAGRSAGCGCRRGRHPQVVRLSRSIARAKSGDVRPPEGRWRDLSNVQFDILLYDLRRAYFGSNPAFERTGQAPLRILARQWSSRWWSPPRACRWPARCCRAIPPTTPRWPIFSSASSSGMARRAARG